MIERHEVELCPGRRVKDVREADRQRLGKFLDTRRLDRDVKRVLEHARREHVAYELRRNRADAGLAGRHNVAVGVYERAREYLKLQLLPLKLRQVWR